MRWILTVTLISLTLTACETSDGGYSTQLPATAPQYGSAADIADFNGARAGQAEGGLNQRGYYLARTQGLTAFWWNESTQTCAGIVTGNGRFTSVTTASRSDCAR